MSPSRERAAYEARQAQLLEALQRGHGFPDGFVASKADAASRALRSKRARAVVRSWPELTDALGAEFTARFDAYARAASAPAFGGGIADGLGFARGVPRDELTPAARVELLLARGRVSMRRGRARARRGAFIGMTTLDGSRRLFIVLRIGCRSHHTVIGFRRRTRKRQRAAA